PYPRAVSAANHSPPTITNVRARRNCGDLNMDRFTICPRANAPWRNSTNPRGGFDASILPRRRRRQEEHKHSIFTPGIAISTQTEYDEDQLQEGKGES